MRFFKQNPALAVGIGLPLLVVIIFLIAAVVPTWFVAAPRYDALFAIAVPTYASHDPAVGEVKYAVDQGHLKAYRRKPPRQGYEVADTQLLRFDAKKGSVREVFVPPSSLTNLADDWQEFPVPEAQGLVLDPNTVSPDGYEFHDRYTYNTEIWPFFGGGETHQGVSIGKGGREVKIPLANVNVVYAGFNVHFLGWITAGEVK